MRGQGETALSPLVVGEGKGEREGGREGRVGFNFPVTIYEVCELRPVTQLLWALGSSSVNDLSKSRFL